MRKSLVGLVSVLIATSASAPQTYFTGAADAHIASAAAFVERVDDGDGTAGAPGADAGFGFAPKVVNVASAFDGRTVGGFRLADFPGSLDDDLGRLTALSSIEPSGPGDTNRSHSGPTFFPNFGRALTPATGDARANSQPSVPGSNGNGNSAIPQAPPPGGPQPAAAIVPEPASWALLIAGFGAVGTALRRQRRGHAAA